MTVGTGTFRSKRRFAPSRLAPISTASEHKVPTTGGCQDNKSFDIYLNQTLFYSMSKRSMSESRLACFLTNITAWRQDQASSVLRVIYVSELHLMKDMHFLQKTSYMKTTRGLQRCKGNPKLYHRNLIKGDLKFKLLD